jgi:hypothetical protein
MMLDVATIGDLANTAGLTAVYTAVMEVSEEARQVIHRQSRLRVR